MGLGGILTTILVVATYVLVALFVFALFRAAKRNGEG